MNELTPKYAKRQAKEAVEHSLDGLINPSDLQENAETWDDIPEDVIKQECYEGAEIMLMENQQPWHSLVHDLAIQEWFRDMPRISMDHLATDDKELVVTEYGYWPNSMSKWEVYEILLEHTNGDTSAIPTDVVNEAVEAVEQGIVEGLRPQ